MTRNVGTTAEVLDAFIDAAIYPNRTPSAPVPGGCRVSVESTPAPDPCGDHDPECPPHIVDGKWCPTPSAPPRMALRSYRTIVAVRIAGRDAVALTPRKYSPTTSKLMTSLRRSLIVMGYRETEETVTVNAAVPGRWGGYGPAWHATGWEALPFAVWTRPDWRERTASDGSRFSSSSRTFEAYEADDPTR